MFFRVNARVLNRGELKEVFYLAESDHETLGDLHDDMLEHGSVLITRFDTRGPTLQEQQELRGRRARYVVSDCDVILGKEGFTTISEMTEDLIDHDGEVLFSVEAEAARREAEDV